MKYYLKRLGHQELGSVKNGKAQRGRYIYISKDKNVLDIFPPLSKTVTNDSSIIPIIPLYQKIAKKIYCNYIYHYLGIINQRGVHWIDPEGKPELELAEDYENRANIAESRGYSRYAGILRVIGDEFKREAKSNILEAKNGDDE